jgi:hypothetical protein
VNYTDITSNFEDHLSIDRNHEGGIIISALVRDPNSNIAIPPFYYPDSNFCFYHTIRFYLYEMEEAIEAYIESTLNELNYVFVEENDENFN